MQNTAHVMMVRPAAFGFNPETADNNAFQEKPEESTENDLMELAQREFDQFVNLLRAAGVDVLVVQDRAQPPKPDAIFPNNWISFHQDGSVITYPMYSPKRRAERQSWIIDEIKTKFEVKREISLADREADGLFLEGTGSLILDRDHRIAYAGISERTHLSVLHDFCELMNYRPISFNAVDPDGLPIYHTNVMMALADKYVVICLDTIQDPDELAQLRKAFQITKKEIVEISFDQVQSFAGNMLQLTTAGGQPLLVMSQQAYDSLLPSQVEKLEHFNPILAAPIANIERVGGGSARCMIAEVFLPAKA